MLVNPENLKITPVSEKGHSAVFVFEPLPTGFGHTLGNALKRVLMTSLEGSAITQVKISGVDHQFTTIPGVKEDVVEISLNLKKVRFINHSKDPVAATINIKGKNAVTAGDIEVSSELEILNKDLVIATLNGKDTSFKAEFIVEKGVGYSAMEERQTSKIGVIVLDALFSPVINAHYEVEPTRFGKITNLDKVTLTVETDGSIEPADAVMQSASILKGYYDRISDWTNSENGAEEEDSPAVKPSKAKGHDNAAIEELPLPTRTINALKKQGIETLGELTSLSDDELADVKNLGEKSVEEIKKLLKKEGYR
jgi:DNA-directed RNA polymerase subunit alpha